MVCLVCVTGRMDVRKFQTVYDNEMFKQKKKEDNFGLNLKNRSKYLPGTVHNQQE